MKIGILRSPLGIGGAELSLLDMAINLKMIGHDVWMHYDIGDTPSMKDFNKHGSLQFRYGADTNFIFENKQITDEMWAIEQLKTTDVVIMIHRHLYSEDLVNAINLVSKKLVYAPGKNSHHVFGKYQDNKGFGHLIQNIDKIMFNSNYTLNIHLNTGYSLHYQKLLTHVHPPIYLDYYTKRYENIDQRASRQKLCFKEGYFHIGIVGRLIPSKEPLEVVKLANQFSKYNIPFKIHFIGDGLLGGQTRQKVKNENLEEYIKFWGMLNDPLEHISCLDVVLHLCKHESLSRAIRESMLMGKPIVAFNGAGNLELLRHPEQRKLLFSKNQDVPEILKYLAENGLTRDELGKLSIEQIVIMERNAIKNLENLIK